MENQINTRPLGVWCYDKSSNKLIKPEDWINNNVSGGVVVVTEEHAFRVLPHPTFVAHWASSNVDTALYKDRITRSNGRYYFMGSPLAEFCKGIGGYLPSVVELKIMAVHLKEINKCMRVMRQPTLPIGWYWSSDEEDSSFAWYVHLDDGWSTYDDMDYCKYCVHAISEFEI